MLCIVAQQLAAVLRGCVLCQVAALLPGSIQQDIVKALKADGCLTPYSMQASHTHVQAYVRCTLHGPGVAAAACDELSGVHACAVCTQNACSCAELQY